jgi:hypothetical protein
MKPRQPVELVLDAGANSSSGIIGLGKMRCANRFVALSLHETGFFIALMTNRKML